MRMPGWSLASGRWHPADAAGEPLTSRSPTGVMGGHGVGDATVQGRSCNEDHGGGHGHGRPGDRRAAGRARSRRDRRHARRGRVPRPDRPDGGKRLRLVGCCASRRSRGPSRGFRRGSGARGQRDVRRGIARGARRGLEWCPRRHHRHGSLESPRLLPGVPADAVRQGHRLARRADPGGAAAGPSGEDAEHAHGRAHGPAGAAGRRPHRIRRWRRPGCEAGRRGPAAQHGSHRRHRPGGHHVQSRGRRCSCRCGCG